MQTVFMELKTPKGEEIVINIKQVSFFCAKKKDTSLITLVDGMQFEIAETYDRLKMRCSRHTDYGVIRPNKDGL